MLRSFRMIHATLFASFKDIWRVGSSSREASRYFSTFFLTDNSETLWGCATDLFESFSQDFRDFLRCGSPKSFVYTCWCTLVYYCMLYIVSIYIYTYCISMYDTLVHQGVFVSCCLISRGIFIPTLLTFMFYFVLLVSFNVLSCLF